MLMEMGRSYGCQAYLWSFLFHFISSLQCFRLLSLPLKLHCSTHTVQKQVYMDIQFFYINKYIFTFSCCVFWYFFCSGESGRTFVTKSYTNHCDAASCFESVSHWEGLLCAATQQSKTFSTVQKVKGEATVRLLHTLCICVDSLLLPLTVQKHTHIFFQCSPLMIQRLVT